MRIRSIVTRTLLLLFTVVLVNSTASAQPPNPSETDTLAPFVTSANITLFNSTSATMGGNVTGDGGAAVTERGVVYSSVNPMPTLGNSKVIIGNGTGVYSQNITGLTGGTLYYVRAYATNVIGTSYGAVVTVTTNHVPPSVITASVAEITNTTATIGGLVSFDGGAAVTERGVVYSTVATTPTTADIKVTMGTGTGTFTSTMTGLVLGTTYYVRAYAINSTGTAYGNTYSFLPAGASVTTTNVSAVGTVSADMGGIVTSIGGSAVTERGIVYVAGNAIPTTADTKVTMGAGIGAFTQTVAGLSPATTYTVRAYATNATTTNYGATQSFTSLTTLTSISRVDPVITNRTVGNYTVVFAQPVASVTANNFSVTTSPGISFADITSITGNGTTWNVTVYTGKGDGTLTLNLTDATGIAPGLSNSLPFAGQTYTIDKTPPVFTSVSIRSNNADITKAKTGDLVSLSFTANEASATLPRVNIAGQTATVTTTGTANTWVATYTMKTTDTEGPIGFTITGVTDVAGNLNLTTTGTTDATAVVFDRTEPAISGITRVGASPTNAASVDFKVTFTEPVSNVDAGDFSLTATFLTGAALSTITGTGAVYTVTVNTGSNNGTIRLDLNASGTGITDRSGNPIANGGYVTGESYTIVKLTGKPVVQTKNPAAVCAPGTVDLTAAAVTAGSDPGLTYTYFTDAAATTPLSNPSAVSASGTYYIVGSNIINIPSDPVAVTVTMNSFAKPAAAFTYNGFCVNIPIIFTNTSNTTGSGNVGYLWTDNIGNTASAANAGFTYTAAGNYSVKLKVFSTVCPNTADSVTQTIALTTPAAGIRMPRMDIAVNDNVQLNARNFGTSYLWAPATGLSNPQVANPVTKLFGEVTYTITITAASGCKTVDTLQIRIFETFVYVPTVFSPNGDGINDLLYVNLVNVTQLKYFRIFNRYGKKVFETSDPTKGWDGRVDGKLQPLDTYVWMMEGVYKNSFPVAMQGTVTLLR